jgi:ABC-type lipoprotein release transport system permease subunit
MFAGLFTSTFINGWMQQRLRDGVETETGHLQVFRKGYSDSGEMELFFASAEALSATNNEAISALSRRVVVQAMAASAETARGVKAFGVDPAAEGAVLNLPGKIIKGTWLESPYSNPVVIGEKLAGELKLNLRSRLVLRFQDLDGTLTGGAFRVVGIFRTSNTSFDGANVWVPDKNLLSLLGMPPGSFHSLIVRLKDSKMTASVKNQLSDALPNAEVLSWKEISPELGYITELSNMYLYIFVVIILLALGFGIINTMLMVVLERVREIGMLMAVGMSRMRIFSMIILETLLLSLFGGMMGIGLGLLVVWRLSYSGIDLSVWGEGLTEMGFNPIVYPVWDANLVVTIGVMVLITGLLAALYPAWKALRLNPSEAIRMI